MSQHVSILIRSISCLISQLLEAGMMLKGRRDFLCTFPSDVDYIIHESGPAPIHTPMELLASLPADVKEKVYIYHCPKNKIPEGSGLKYLEVSTLN